VCHYIYLICIYININIYINIYINIHEYIYIYIYIYVCIYIYLCIHIYICIYTPKCGATIVVSCHTIILQAVNKNCLISNKVPPMHEFLIINLECLCWNIYNFVYLIVVVYILRRYSTDAIPTSDDDDVYLDILQTRGVTKSILYMWNVDYSQ
jgi:hypothetical protein